MVEEEPVGNSNWRKWGGRKLEEELIILGIVVILIIGIVSQYNSLVTLETNVDAKWAQVENQLQRRADLIQSGQHRERYAATRSGFFRNCLSEPLLSARDPSAQ